MQSQKFALSFMAAVVLSGCASAPPVAHKPVDPVAVTTTPMPGSATAQSPASIAEKAQQAGSQLPGHVLINTRHDAFVVYSALPKSISTDELDTMTAKAQADSSLRLFAWEAFAGKTAQVSERITRNDYPEINIDQSVLELIKRYPGKMFAVTWNGGLAVTAAEFKYATNTWEQYQANPAVVVRDPQAQDDPVYPLNRIARMLRASR